MKKDILVIAILVVFNLSLFNKLIYDGGNSYYGGSGSDSGIFYNDFNHGKDILLGKDSILDTNRIFYPFGTNLVQHVNLLGPSLALSPITLVTNPYFSSGIYLIITFILNGFAIYKISSLFSSFKYSVMVGLFACVSPVILNRVIALGQFNLIAACTYLFFFYGCLQYFYFAKNGRYLLLMTIMLITQVWTDPFFVAVSLISVTIVLFTYVFNLRALIDQTIANWRPIIISLLLFIICSFPYITSFNQFDFGKKDNSIQRYNVFVSDVFSYLLSPAYQDWYEPWNWQKQFLREPGVYGIGGETFSTFGYIPLIILIVALIVAVLKLPKYIVKMRAPRWRGDSFLLLIIVVFLLMSLGPYVHVLTKFKIYIFGVNIYLPSLYWIARYIPIISEIREPSRFSIIVGLLSLPLSVVMISKIRRVYIKIIILSLFVSVTWFEYKPFVNKFVDSRIAIPPICTYMTKQIGPDSLILELPISVSSGLWERNYWLSIDSMFLQTCHNAKTFNGHVARMSKELMSKYGHYPFNLLTDSINKDALKSIIMDFHPDYILVHKKHNIPITDYQIFLTYQNVYEDENYLLLR